jgi:hypothetical protein
MNDHVAYWDGRGAFEVYGSGLDDRIPLEDFVRYAAFIGGRWFLPRGAQSWRLLFRFLRDEPDLLLRGQPSRIYSVHLLSRRMELRDADSVLAAEPTSARQAYQYLRALCTLTGDDTPPFSCGHLLTRLLDEGYERERFPARGQILRLAPGGRQQLFWTRARAEAIRIFDLRSAYASAAAQYPIPRGRGDCGQPTPLGETPDGWCRVLEVWVDDRSAHGCLPRQSHGRAYYARGHYQTTVAEPLLLAALNHGIRAYTVLAEHWYPTWDLSWILSHAWDRRCAAEAMHLPYEAAIWKLAMQQFLGKFSERPALCEYVTHQPRQVSGWRVVSWDDDVWARDQVYYPSLYHPTAGAWIRQCAQIPLLAPLATRQVARVYVDSVTTLDLALPTGPGLGDWREIAAGTHWQAKDPGNAVLSGADDREIWRAGQTFSGFSLEKPPKRS